MFSSIDIFSSVETHFYQLGTDEGLAVSTIHAIKKAPDGRIWIAKDGDGIRWWNGTSFQHPPGIEKLHNLYVRDIDFQQDVIWVATEAGFSRYNGSFTNFSLPYGREKANRIRSTSDQLYVLAEQTGLWYGEADSLELFWKPSARLLLYDFWMNDDFLVVATHQGLWVYDKDLQLINHFLTTEIIRCIHWEEEREELWIGSAKGLYSMQLSIKELQPPALIDIRADVRSIESDPDGEALWIGTDGAGVYWGKEGNWQQYHTENGLRSNQIRSLLPTSEAVWIAGLRGIAVRENFPLQRLQSDIIPENSLVYSGVAVDDQLWLSSSEGICVLENDQLVCRMQEEEGIPQGVFFSMHYHQSAQEVWVAGENGLLQISADRKSVRNHAAQLPDPFVFSVTTHAGFVLAGTASGLYAFDRENALWKPYPPEKPIRNSIYALETRENELYIATLDTGIFKLQNHEIVAHWDVFDARSLSSYSLASFALGRDGTMWVGTNGDGLIRLSDEGLQRFTIENGLPSNNVWAIHVVDKDQLLLAYQNGLIWYDAGGSKKSYRLEQEQGFPPGQSLRNALFEGLDGYYWLGTSAGLLRFHRDNFLANLRPPRPELLRVDLYFNPQTDWESKELSLEKYSGVPKAISLSYKENYLRFAFGSWQKPVFGAPVHYRYRMAGLDPNWIETTQLPEAVYTDIAHGHYTFEVQARLSNTAWSESYALDLRISPPWWKEPLFLIFFSLIVLAGSFLLIRYRIRQLNEKVQLENAVMTNERIALRLQMNPHFLFNALDSIGNFIMKADTPSAMRYLGSFTKLMRLTLESGTENNHAVETEVALLRHYLELEQLRFDHAFEFRIHMDEEIDYDISIPPMLIQPHVENAILHGLRPLKERLGMLRIRFLLIGDDILEVSVEDNGVGREYSRQLKEKSDRAHRSMALDINRKRIDLLSRSYGQQFSLNIIDLYDDEGKAAGTKVVMRLPVVCIQ